MVGLILLICILIVMAFVLAWVTGIVAREELTVTRAVVILIANAIVGFIVSFALASTEMDETMLQLINIPISLVILAGMLRLVGQIAFKHALIIAAAFSVLLFLISLLIAAIAG